MLKNKKCVVSNKIPICFKWLLCVVFISTFLTAVAQNESEKGFPFVTNYPPKLYNASPNNWSVIEDNDGIMYFGGNKAKSNILQFDGEKWAQIGGTNISVVTRCFAKDTNGTIFYGGFADFGYLDKDSTGTTFQHSLLEFVPKDKRNFSDIWSIHVTGDGIYFQSRERIFRLIRNNAGNNRSWSLKSWEPSTHFMYSFYLEGSFYVHEQSVGFLKMISDSLTLIPGSEFMGQDRVQVMLPYNDNSGSNNTNSSKKYLVGSFNHGMYVFDGKTFTPFKNDADSLVRHYMLYKGLYLNGNYVLSLLGYGIIIMNPQSKILQELTRNTIDVPSNIIYSMYPDSKGDVWLTTDNGISRLALNSPFTVFTAQNGIDATPLSIARLPNGKLYVGTNNNLLEFDEKTSAFKIVESIPRDQIFALLVDGSSLLVSSNGLYMIKDGKVILVQPSVSNNLKVSALTILRQHSNTLLASASFGMAVFQRDPTSVKGWKFLSYLPGYKGESFSVQEDSAGNVWTVTQDGLAHRIKLFFDQNGQPDLSKTVIQSFGPEQGAEHTFGYIYSIRNQPYFTSDSATYKFNNEKGRFEEASFNGLRNFGGIEDSSGKVWIGRSRRGVSTVQYIIATPKPDGSYSLDSTSLLPIAEETFTNVHSDKNGIVWIISNDKVIRYNENIKTDIDKPYKTLITAVTANKQQLDPYVADKNFPNLKFDNNSLRFDYAAPFYEGHDKIQYKTMLEGFEKTWSAWGNNFYKEYTNLPPGKYKFHVRALNIFKKQSEEATYEFIILSPWYRTWWAYLIYAFVTFLIIYGIINWRTRKLKEKHIELEKTVEERTSELSQRAAELAVINSVQEALVREMDMQGIYNLVGERVQKLFNAQVVIIATFDHENNLENFNYHFEKGEISHPNPRHFDKVRQHLIDTGQNILINKDVLKAAAEFGLRVVPGTEMPKSLLFMPLKVGDKVTGYVSLQNIDKENAFSSSDVRLLSTLANSMSVALENARLFDETIRLLKETEQRTAELSVINSVQEGLAKELHMQAIYEMVGDKLSEVMHTLDIDIRLFSPETNQVFYSYMRDHGVRMDIPPQQMRGMSKHVFETSQTLIINEKLAERMAELGSTPVPGTQMEKSYMAVPIMVGNNALGMVSMSNYEKENAFSDSEVRLLQTVVSAMSVALENARLFDETNRLLKETEQRTAELAVINSVQEGLAKELDMQAIYDLVGQRISNVFKAQAIIIATLNTETNSEYFNYVVEKGERFYLKPRPFDKLRQHLIETREKILINSNYEEAAAKFGMNVLPGTKHPKSLLFVPLIIGDKVKSYVSLQNVDIENAFSDADVRLLETLANSMSVALENARLFDETSRLLKETEQKTAELAVINSVQDGLVREMKMQSIYDLVGNRICELFDTQTVIIRTFDHKTGNEEWQFAIERGERLHSNPRPLIWANKQLISNKQPLLINENYLQFASQHGGTGVSKGLPPKSAIFVPMIVGDLVRGSVSLQNVEKENAFSENDLRLLTTLTNSMSVALENARLFDETTHLLADAKQRASELSTVNNISKALASKLDAGGLIKLVGDQLKDLFKANIVYLALLDKKTNIIHFPYQYGDNMTPMKLGKGLTSNIILKGEPLLLNKDVDEKTGQLGLQRVGLPAASYLGVPIPVGDEMIGVLSVQSTEQENRFNENDLRLLSTIASSVGVALKNAQLFDDVQQAKMEAEQASKIAEKANEAKSAFLSTVSHELRTPLTSVLGFAKIIKKRLEEKIFPTLDKTDSKTEKTVDQISENLKVVISEGERLTHLINDVLDLAKIEAGKMEWNQENVSLAEVIERAAAATTSLFDQKDIKLINHIDNDVPNIIGDTDKLIQVVINLFSNSVKFTDSGSVTCTLSQNNDEVIVSIADTGIGIAKEDYGAVFEQFKQVGGDTLTDKPKGTGLGLPICKEIIEHHGGRIWLESEVGKGSIFSFALPLVPSGKKSHETPIHLNELMKQLKEQMVFSKLKMVGKNATILVVDDDDSIRSLLHQELSDAGYVIEEARDGKMALESIRKNRPDLIILDVMMPEINGFDVAAILKNDPQTMDIPIIILSIVQDKARGFRIGVDRYLTKPIDTAKLFEEVGNLLEQGKSKKKVMVVDEDSSAVRSLTEVLQTKGYIVVESDGKELIEKAISTQPDIIILNSVLSDKNEIVQSLRFEKGLENVLFLIYQ